MKKILYLFMMAALLIGCNQEEFEGYDTPFVHIATSDGLSATTVLTNVSLSVYRHLRNHCWRWTARGRRLRDTYTGQRHPDICARRL